MNENLPLEPRIIRISAVGSNILAIQVEEGWIEGGVQIPYEPQEGETLCPDVQNPHLIWIDKNGEHIGVFVKDKVNGDQRFVFETLHGYKLSEKADLIASYNVNGQNPHKVWRKSKPSNMEDPVGGVTVEHMIYLILDEEFHTSTKYHLQFEKGLFDLDEYEFVHDPMNHRSEAVHVTQLGFRPNDPSKKAFLSQWMGLGGGVQYTGYRTFHILDDATGKTLYSGQIQMQNDGMPVPINNSAIDLERMKSEPRIKYDEITIHSAVYEMDFSDFTEEGCFRIYVPDLGCSFPFHIDERATWLRGFKLSMKGLYHHRSGIVTGEPYTSFSRPRVYHPDDGRVIYHSDCSLFESGNGLNCYGTDVDNFGNLMRKSTDIVVDNAWGGYFDACDWDRRIQHLHATQMHLELYLMFPDFFRNLDLNIPESGNGIPDIINEGLYNIDHYRRMQTTEGGIRGGVEAEEHPILGQGGWQDSWPAFAYAPDFWSSHWYVSAAARASYALRKIQPELAEVYCESAQRAMDWAEDQFASLLEKEGHKWTQRAHYKVRETRELAAVDMFRLTNDVKYDVLYQELRQEHSYEASFVYATLPQGHGDSHTRQKCIHSILMAAERALQFAAKAPFRLATSDPEHTRIGPFGSFYTVSNNVELIRAHYLTGDNRYLAGAIDACQFACGANPTNLCYTTGVGPKCPVNVLHHDSRLTGQSVPVGITVFGPHNMNFSDRAGFIPFLRADRFWPGIYSWPASESYFDVYRFPSQAEYTVQSTIGPNAYNWGYLAAAKA
jgi:endoglucanase